MRIYENNIWKILGLLCIWATASPEAVAQAPDTIFQVGKLEITGNRRTKAFIIARELDLMVGDTIHSRHLAARLERNRQRVFNTTLFVYVKVLASKRGNQLAINIEVKENWYLWAAPVFKLADRNFNEWWNERDRDLRRTTFGAFLYHANFRGRKEKLRFAVETGFSDRLQVSYEIPYLDKKRQTGINVLARYRGFQNMAFNTANDKLVYTGPQDTEIKTQWEGLIQLQRRRGFYEVHRLELGYIQDRITDTVVQLNPYYHLNSSLVQRYFEVAYQYSHDTRDNVNYPIAGLVIVGSIRQRGLFPTDDLRSLELRVGGGYYRPLTNRWSWGLVGKWRFSYPQNQPFNQLRGLGYEEEFLRGFDLYVINGTAFGLGKSSLRYRLWERILSLHFIPVKQFNTLPLAIYPTIFADAGYVRNRFPAREIQSTLSNQWLASVGVGLEIVALLNTTMRLNVSRNSIGQTNFFINMQKEFLIR